MKPKFNMNDAPLVVPMFSEEEAAQIAHSLFGIPIETAKSLGSCQEANFLLKPSNHVLKVKKKYIYRKISQNIAKYRKISQNISEFMPYFPGVDCEPWFL
jgi:hypothetical protein